MIVGFTNGCFDIIHIGHIKVLSEAKRMCDELHVGINSDISVKKLKGYSRPIISENERFEIISSIKYVDYVYIFDEETPIKLIESIMPDIIVKGGEYNHDDVVGSHIAKVITIPMISNISTTKIINKIQMENENL